MNPTTGIIIIRSLVVLFVILFCFLLWYVLAYKKAMGESK